MTKLYSLLPHRHVGCVRVVITVRVHADCAVVAAAVRRVPDLLLRLEEEHHRYICAVREAGFFYLRVEILKDSWRDGGMSQT